MKKKILTKVMKKDVMDIMVCLSVQTIIIESLYGYLPREFIEKCTEDEAREYIKKNIG